MRRSAAILNDLKQSICTSIEVGWQYSQKKKLPAITYLFKVNNRISINMCSNLLLKIRHDFLLSLLLILNIYSKVFWCFYCWLGTIIYFLCPILSTFKYLISTLLQLLTDVPKSSEVATDKKRLWLKVVVFKKIILCSLLYLVAGNRFFQSTVFLYFKKVVVAIHFSMILYFLLKKGRCSHMFFYDSLIWRHQLQPSIFLWYCL